MTTEGSFHHCDCPHCGVEIEFPVAEAGEGVLCPKCSEPVLLTPPAAPWHAQLARRAVPYTIIASLVVLGIASYYHAMATIRKEARARAAQSAQAARHLEQLAILNAGVVQSVWAANTNHWVECAFEAKMELALVSTPGASFEVDLAGRLERIGDFLSRNPLPQSNLTARAFTGRLVKHLQGLEARRECLTMIGSYKHSLNRARDSQINELQQRQRLVQELQQTLAEEKTARLAAVRAVVRRGMAEYARIADTSGMLELMLMENALSKPNISLNEVARIAPGLALDMAPILGQGRTDAAEAAAEKLRIDKQLQARTKSLEDTRIKATAAFPEEERQSLESATTNEIKRIRAMLAELQAAPQEIRDWEELASKAANMAKLHSR